MSTTSPYWGGNIQSSLRLKWKKDVYCKNGKFIPFKSCIYRDEHGQCIFKSTEKLSTLYTDKI